MNLQCSKQAYFSKEYKEYKNELVDTKANQNYKQFCKRAFHKARRKHDKDVISQQINDILATRPLLNKNFEYLNY